MSLIAGCGEPVHHLMQPPSNAALANLLALWKLPAFFEARDVLGRVGNELTEFLTRQHAGKRWKIVTHDMVLLGSYELSLRRSHVPSN